VEEKPFCIIVTKKNIELLFFPVVFIIMFLLICHYKITLLLSLSYISLFFGFLFILKNNLDIKWRIIVAYIYLFITILIVYLTLLIQLDIDSILAMSYIFIFTGFFILIIGSRLLSELPKQFLADKVNRLNTQIEESNKKITNNKEIINNDKELTILSREIIISSCDKLKSSQNKGAKRSTSISPPNISIFDSYLPAIKNIIEKTKLALIDQETINNIMDTLLSNYIDKKKEYYPTKDELEDIYNLLAKLDTDTMSIAKLTCKINESGKNYYIDKIKIPNELLFLFLVYILGEIDIQNKKKENESVASQQENDKEELKEVTSQIKAGIFEIKASPPITVGVFLIAFGFLLMKWDEIYHILELKYTPSAETTESSTVEAIMKLRSIIK